jgi:hypothetical protein
MKNAPAQYKGRRTPPPVRLRAVAARDVSAAAVRAAVGAAKLRVEQGRHPCPLGFWPARQRQPWQALQRRAAPRRAGSGVPTQGRASRHAPCGVAPLETAALCAGGGVLTLVSALGLVHSPPPSLAVGCWHIGRGIPVRPAQSLLRARFDTPRHRKGAGVAARGGGSR